MATSGGGFGRLIVREGPRIAMRYGPSLLKAVQTVRDFIKDHPALPQWVQDRLNEITKQVDVARKRRGDAAQIRAMLDIVREQVVSMGTSADTTRWTDHADNIGRRVGIAEQLSQPTQKAKLADLKAETETLLAGFIDAIAYVPPAPQN